MWYSILKVTFHEQIPNLRNTCAYTKKFTTGKISNFVMPLNQVEHFLGPCEIYDTPPKIDYSYAQNEH